MKHGALNISLRTALILVLFTATFTAFMSLAFFATKDIIAASAEAEKLRMIGEVLPPSAYDNELLRDYIDLPATPALGLDRPSRIYRARRGGAPQAIVFEAVAPDGYSGKINLLLAIRTNGELLAVRVTSHKETPGLGDYIDPRKDKNKEHPWIRQFDGQSLTALPLPQWRVKKDGGRFDQRSGATISARAVTSAVARAMQWAAIEGGRTLASAPTSAAEKAQEKP